MVDLAAASLLEQAKIEELTRELRRLQLESDGKVATLTTQLRAEQEKSRALEEALHGKEDTAELQGRVKEAEETEKKLRTELVRMTRRSVLITEEDSVKARLRELETENFLLNQKVKGLEKQVKDVKASAVSDR